MELEKHTEALRAAYDRLGESAQHYERVAFVEHPYNPLHPERWKAFGGNVKALARASFELLRLAPHLNEIRQLNKEREE